jgi:hypothetical protein
VAIVTIHDRADELRFEILGHFAGDSVSELATKWVLSLPNSFHRKFTVDISGMTDYDAAGRKLLYRMYRHGTQFACGTPQSLIFLKEISTAAKPAPAPAFTEESAVVKPHTEKQRDVRWEVVAKPIGRGAGRG